MNQGCSEIVSARWLFVTGRQCIAGECERHDQLEGTWHYQQIRHQQAGTCLGTPTAHHTDPAQLPRLSHEDHHARCVFVKRYPSQLHLGKRQYYRAWWHNCVVSWATRLTECPHGRHCTSVAATVGIPILGNSVGIALKSAKILLSVK